MNNLQEICNPLFLDDASFPISDEHMAKAYDLLHGENYKPYLPTPIKAKNMYSILIGRVQPNQDFERYIKCIDYLKAKL